jgi:hypothetical protein
MARTLKITQNRKAGRCWRNRRGGRNFHRP